MTELKAMTLVGVGVLLLGLFMSVALIVARAPGELLVVAFAISGGIGSLATVRVIKHYEAVQERRKREEILLSR